MLKFLFQSLYYIRKILFNYSLLSLYIKSIIYVCKNYYTFSKRLKDFKEFEHKFKVFKNNKFTIEIIGLNDEIFFIIKDNKK